MDKKEIALAGITALNSIAIIGLLVAVSINGISTEKNASDIFKENINSIVEVKASSSDVGESYGTGVIYKSKGYFVTNAHVVHYTEVGEEKMFDKYEVRFADEEEYQSATFIRMDTKNDLAILKIDEKKTYKPVTFAKTKYTYGDKVYAMGNTSNYGIGISEGIISVPEVYVTYNDISRLVIQADINISNGNSGGALLDRRGHLIGLTTFRTKDLSGNVNYGFTYSISLSAIETFTRGGN